MIQLFSTKDDVTEKIVRSRAGVATRTTTSKYKQSISEAYKENFVIFRCVEAILNASKMLKYEVVDLDNDMVVESWKLKICVDDLEIFKCVIIYMIESSYQINCFNLNLAVRQVLNLIDKGMKYETLLKNNNKKLLDMYFVDGEKSNVKTTTTENKTPTTKSTRGRKPNVNKKSK